MQDFSLLLTQSVAYLGPADHGNGPLTSGLEVSSVGCQVSHWSWCVL